MKEMPRTSKLTVAELEEMKHLLTVVPRPTQKSIALRFHVASASVFYYQKKFNILPIVSVVAVEQPRKLKSYEDYLREYYKRHNLPYKKPPHPENYWMPDGHVSCII